MAGRCNINSGGAGCVVTKRLEASVIPNKGLIQVYRRCVHHWVDQFVFAFVGFAVADCNYGGSTGYGREYRNRWGSLNITIKCLKIIQYKCTSIHAGHHEG